ncbi:LPS assembly lipoprotein LptE [bacterium]
MISIAVLIAIFFCVQCGVYTFSGSTLPAHIKTVGIPLFEDRTAEFGIDQQITDLIIDAIRDDNTLKIADPGNADALLHGVITSIREPVGQYDANETASDFRVSLSIKASFEDMHQREVRWEGNFSDFGTYDNIETTREDAIKEAVDKIAEDIINKTVSDW